MILGLHQRLEGRGPQLEAAACCHVGLRRKNNEDELLFEPERGLFAVIDGMGGEAGGEIAADLARATFLERVGPSSSGPEGLARAMAEASRVIFRRAQSDLALRGMGCVATLARVSPELLEIAHVGDTRAWLAGADGCQQLTRDHTAAAEARERALVEGGEPRPTHAHAVTRDLGGRDRDVRGRDVRGRDVRDRDVRDREGDDWVDRLAQPLRPGDLLLMASDGLHDVASEAELLRKLSQAYSSRKALGALVDELVELALSRGGPDNISVLAVRVLEPVSPVQRPRWVTPLVLLLCALLGAALVTWLFPPVDAG